MKLIKRAVFLLLLSGCAVYSQQAMADDTPTGDYLHWNYKLGGEERLRYEDRENFDLSDSKKDQSQHLLHRLKINGTADLTDEYLNRIMTVFVEGLDARDFPIDTKAVAGQTDRFDLHQAFVDIYNVMNSNIDLKLGRQELNYGAKRLIASPVWLNAVRAWDGAVVHYQKNGLYSDLIYGQNTQYQDKEFNVSDGHEIIWGSYSGYQQNAVSPLVEWYWLEQDDTRGISDIHRQTAGARSKLNLTPSTVLDVEVPYQWGRTGNLGSTKQVRAYAYHANVAQNLNDILWTPQLNFAYDVASGNRNPTAKESNTFVPLYQTVHEPYGEMDFFRWENVRNPEFNIIFSPTDKFRFTPQIDFFWLQNTNDSWYNSSGTAMRAIPAGKKSTYVGSEASLRLYYDLTPNVKLEGGYAHFFSGTYAQQSGANDDADWFYTQITLKY